MRAQNYRYVICCWLLFFCLGLPANSGRTESSSSDPFNPERVTWRRLAFGAKNFFGTVTTDIRLETIRLQEVSDGLITMPQGAAFQPSAGTLFAVSVHSVADPLLGSDEDLNITAWYDPKGGNALQRIRLLRGKEIWQKTYRFSDKGVFRLRRIPKGPDEPRLPAENWTDIEKSFYPYPSNDAGCTSVLEPSVLMFLVSAVDPAVQDPPSSLCVFNKKQLHEVRIHREGIKPLKINYLQKSSNQAIRRQTQIDAIRFSCRSRSLAGPDQEAEPFSFLGLSGDVDIYVDATTRIPVSVSGRIAGFGRIDIQLHEVEMKPKK